MLEEIEALETSLSLTSVTPEVIWELGTSLAQKAMDKKLPIGIEIRIGELCAFCFAADGVTPNTQNWINRKLNTCDFFGHSTLWVNEKTGGDASLLDTKYGLDPHLSANAPGGMPIILPVSSHCPKSKKKTFTGYRCTNWLPLLAVTAP